jgi:signal transduction histidine kinase
MLEVTDNGRGIRPEELEGEDSFGIMGMKERCAYLGGSVDFEGRAGEGTRVLVTVPLGGKKEC